MNKFGQSYVAGTQAELLFGLFDPREALYNRERFRRGALPLLSRVNSIYIPAGEYAVRGWILIRRSELDQLDKFSTNLQLEIANSTNPNNIGILRNLCIVQAQCVTRGLASDPNALYIVELTDGRGIVSNQWFSAPINAKYNIRAPAYPQGGSGSGTYYIDSMNDGTTWTWSTMLQNIWEQMGTYLGTWPGLPITPLGTPEGFWFSGVSAWDALCTTLQHIGLGVACNLTQDDPYTIIIEGADDPSFSALQTLYADRLEDDLEWIDYGSGRVPGIVKVLFRRRNSVYGNEETVRRDALQWSTDSIYEVSVNAPAIYEGGVGRHYIWSDFTVRYDQDGAPLAADVTAAAAIAQERVNQYFGVIHSRGFMSQTYTGALPFVTGTEVDGVCYYQDLRSNDYYGGWRTQIVHSPGHPPWLDIWN